MPMAEVVFAFAGRRRRDRGDEDEFRPSDARGVDAIQRELGFEPAVELEFFGREIEPRGNFGDGTQR